MNNRPVGLVTAATDVPELKKTYAYDPHLDPQLVWAGKKERNVVRGAFRIVHERIDPRTLLASPKCFEHFGIGGNWACPPIYGIL